MTFWFMTGNSLTKNWLTTNWIFLSHLKEDINMARVNNDAGVLYAKTGMYCGKKVTITHRDPASDMVYLEDFPVQIGKSVEYGAWVHKSEVQFD